MTELLETLDYRVIIVRQDSAAVLALRTPAGYRLPSVRVSRCDRPAKQLREAIRTAWGIQIFILDLYEAMTTPDRYAVAEVLTTTSTQDLEAIALDRISASELTEEARAKAVALLHGEASSPFARVGWLDEAVQWLESVTKRRVSSNASIEQYNAGGAFSLIRFQAEDGSRFWLKATGEPNAHEFPLTCFLSKICGAYLPEILATKPEWNAWLMCGEATDISHLQPSSVELQTCLEDAARSLALIQIQVIDQRPALFDRGAFDQSTTVMLWHADAIFSQIEHAMSLQTSTKVPRLEKSRLRDLRQIFGRAIEYTERLGFPDTVLHGDISLGNILKASTHCKFTDWCEAYVGFPLIALQHLLLLNSEEDPKLKLERDCRIVNKYRAVMADVCDPEIFQKGLTMMPLLAAASALYGRGRWIKDAPRNHPRRQAYVRTLARHIDRAARDPQFLAAIGC